MVLNIRVSYGTGSLRVGVRVCLEMNDIPYVDVLYFSDTKWCCFKGEKGQLGQGTTDNYTVPPSNPISLNSNFDLKELVTGYKHTCALSFDGRVACWGYVFYLNIAWWCL